MSRPFIALITGPAGVGKSTTAELLCKEYERSARIDVDYLRHMLRSGNVPPYPYTDEAKRQVTLATHNACQLAKNFNDYNFSVFIDDVVTSKEKLDLYIDLTQGYNFYIFLLMTDKNTLQQRDQGRLPEHHMGQRSLELHDEFSQRMDEDRWHLLDTTNQTTEQTTRHIKQYFDSKLT